MYKSRKKKKAYTKYSVTIKFMAPTNYSTSVNYARKRTSSGGTSRVYATVSDVEFSPRTVDMSTVSSYNFGSGDFGRVSSTWNDGTTSSTTRSYTMVNSCWADTSANNLTIRWTFRIGAGVGSTTNTDSESYSITIPVSQLEGYHRIGTITGPSDFSVSAKYDGTTVAYASLANCGLDYEITIIGIE
jgi:hypothetical protein